MYYGGFSWFWVLVFLVAFVYLNSKINRIARSEKAPQKEPLRPQQPATPPSFSKVAASFAEPPVQASVSEAVARPASSTPSSPQVATSAEKVNSEEKGSQWLGKIGIIAIVLGVSFFLKWTFDNNIIGPMGRVMLGILGGMGFVVTGQFLRKKYLVYSDILTGGGIAILYLSIFAAYAFYHFIGSGVAMTLMLFVTALSVTLSVLGGTQQLAVLGIVGGFLTPFLISVPGNNFGQLMSYLTILDLGILGVAIFKKWNRLNLLGFIGTVLWSLVWFERFYTPAQLPQVFAVATIFFIIYLIAGIVHNVLWKKQSQSEDLFLITCNAAFYAIAAYTILNPEYHNVMGFFMFFLSLFYFVIAFVAYRMNPEDKLLGIYLPGIAIIFLTLAMPIQFSGKWITLAWLSEAALLVGAGSVVRRHTMNLFGFGVYTIGLVRFFAFDAGIQDLATFTPIFNARFFIVVVAVVVAYFMGYMLMRHVGEGDEEGRKHGAAVLFIVANVLSLFMITIEINTHAEKSLLVSERRFQVTREEYSASGNLELSERAQAEFRQKEDASFAERRSIQNRRNTLVSIAWALYATVLTAVGFTLQRRLLRVLGLTLLFVTAFKVLIDVWQLGELYRIISSISFGVIALLVSFAYAKWKHRLQEVL